MTDRTTRARAFTLLEVLVVVVILAVLASLAVPRFTGTTRRVFNLTVDRVADLLVMFAQRDSLAQKPVGLRYDEARRQLLLVILDRDPAESGTQAEWLIDPFVAPVTLPDAINAEKLAIYADGEWVDIRDWPLNHTPGETRPSIEIYLSSADDEYETTLRLAPHAVSPSRSDEDDAFAARTPIDLDRAGRSREDW